jgi:hypothetical protein
VVNTGEVVVRSITTGEGRTEYAPVGHSTSLAARMQALAPIGSIATTEDAKLMTFVLLRAANSVFGWYREGGKWKPQWIVTNVTEQLVRSVKV